MAPTTKKKRRPTKDGAFVSTEDEPLTKKCCTCTCIIDSINGDETITVKLSGNMDTRASSSKSKEPVTLRTPPVKSKAPVTLRTPRSNKGQLPSVPEPRTPITRSKKEQLLSGQEPSTLDVHSRQDPPTVPFSRKWSKNDELRILRGLQEHRELHGKQPDLAVLYDKITRNGSFDNHDAGIPKFKDKVRKLLRLYKKMIPMEDPKGDDHKIELFRIACSVWGDLASNAHAHGADVDADIDAAAAASAINNAHAHGLAAPLGVHAGVVASQDAPPPGAPLDAHAGMGASPDDPPAPATTLAAHAGTGASRDALAAPATVGMPLLVKRAVSSPAALARASPTALACASPAAPADVMLLSSGTTTTSFCVNSRDEDEPSQWLRVVLRWGSRVAFLVAFAAFMSPGWREGGYREFMEFGGLLP